MNRLEECRRAKGFTQKYVASAIGIKPPQISKWESGTTRPSRKNYIKLANLYGVSVDYLLGLTDDPQGVQEVTLEPCELTDAELMKIPSIAMMARKMGQLTEAQRQQMLAVGNTLIKEFFNMEPGLDAHPADIGGRMEVSKD